MLKGAKKKTIKRGEIFRQKVESYDMPRPEQLFPLFHLTATEMNEKMRQIAAQSRKFDTLSIIFSKCFKHQTKKKFASAKSYTYSMLKNIHIS